jgi:hypothetical protein
MAARSAVRTDGKADLAHGRATAGAVRGRRDSNLAPGRPAVRLCIALRALSGPGVRIAAAQGAKCYAWACNTQLLCLYDAACCCGLRGPRRLCSPRSPLLLVTRCHCVYHTVCAGQSQL